MGAAEQGRRCGASPSGWALQDVAVAEHVRSCQSQRRPRRRPRHGPEPRRPAGPVLAPTARSVGFNSPSEPSRPPRAQRDGESATDSAGIIRGVHRRSGAGFFDALVVDRCARLTGEALRASVKSVGSRLAPHRGSARHCNFPGGHGHGDRGAQERLAPNHRLGPTQQLQHNNSKAERANGAIRFYRAIFLPGPKACRFLARRLPAGGGHL